MKRMEKAPPLISALYFSQIYITVFKKGKTDASDNHT